MAKCKYCGKTGYKYKKDLKEHILESHLDEVDEWLKKMDEYDKEHHITRKSFYRTRGWYVGMMVGLEWED